MEIKEGEEQRTFVAWCRMDNRPTHWITCTDEVHCVCTKCPMRAKIKNTKEMNQDEIQKYTEPYRSHWLRF